MHTRRQFCADACHAALVGGALGPLAGCGGGGGGSSSPSSPSGSTPAPALARLTATRSGNLATLTIDASSPLAAVGGAGLVQAGASQLLVSRTGASTFTALTAICTHEACTIDGFANARFVCPCHGSSFDTGGRVVTGPAVTALRTFPASLSGSVLTVTL